MFRLPPFLARQALILTAGASFLFLLTWTQPAGSARVEAVPAPSLAGRFLVAARGMRDPNFARTVIYMVQHDETGALGLVINRPLGEMPLSQVMTGLGLKGEGMEGSLRVHAGGPVEPNQPFLLHSSDVVVEQSMIVSQGVAVTSDPEILHRIGEGAGPRQALLVLGYSGWAPGQLEAEMARGDWGDVASDQAVVFDRDHETKWERTIQRFSIDL
ncbi:MAG: YqgE/AlgH family protein [Kiloniellales bacterium]|nr:YqgE/AlgH family protein [Kiloniellales bacterium]